MKILGMTDLHLSSSNPASRIDDYPQAMLEKLKYLARFVRENKVGAVICAGDWSHVKGMTLPYLNQVLEVLRSFKCDLYGIGGNHDYYFGREDSVDRVVLGTLYSSGVVKDLVAEGPLVLDKVRITGLNFSANPKPPHYTALQKPDGIVNLLIAHAFWKDSIPWGENERLWPKDVAGYQMLFLGHDHKPYGITTEDGVDGKLVIIRPGSLSRGTQAAVTQDRPVMFFTLDTITLEIETHEVPVTPASEVFSKEVAEEKVVNREVKSFAKALTMTYKSGETGVVEAVKELCSEGPVRNRVLQYFQKRGIVTAERLEEVTKNG